jgi:hypothetical protein
MLGKETTCADKAPERVNMTEAITTTSTTIHHNGSAPVKGSIVAVGSKRYHMGDTSPTTHTNGSAVHANGSGLKKNGVAKTAGSKRCLWFEEELEDDLRWVFGVSK